jgi:hypothetical protein
MKKLLMLITFILILSNLKAESILYERDSYCYAQKGETILYMDVYKRVDAKQSSPCMLFLFGGGFTVGNRRDRRYLEYFEHLLSEGIVVVAIDYRLGMVGVENEPWLYPDALEYSIKIGVEDLFDTVKYLQNNAEILSIDKDKIISVAELGSSEELKVGDTAFAVGAPLDSSTYAWTVTRGIISGKDREVATQQNVMKVLQTDTAINSGNSGGPLCNSNGEVIGITNMKLASSSIEGMGFAIPIETAIKNAENLMEGKEVERPYLGVEIGQASKSYYGEDTYVYINKVEEDGSADKAGLKAGDIILEVNDVEVDTIVHFQYELYKYKIGDKIKITIERNGEEKTLVVKLGTKNKEA